MTSKFKELLAATSGLLKETEGALRKAAASLEEREQENRALREELLTKRAAAPVITADIADARQVVELAKQAGIITPAQEAHFTTRLTQSHPAALELLKSAMLRTPHVSGRPVSRATSDRKVSGEKDAAAGRRHV